MHYEIKEIGLRSSSFKPDGLNPYGLDESLEDDPNRFGLSGGDASKNLDCNESHELTIKEQHGGLRAPILNEFTKEQERAIDRIVDTNPRADYHDAINTVARESLSRSGK
jgi:hypothetical protein